MDEKIKRLKFAMICYYFAAAGFYLASSLYFIFGQEEAMLNICLGSAMLCMGAATTFRLIEERHKDDSDNSN